MLMYLINYFIVAECIVVEDQKVSTLLEEYSDERLVFKRRNLQIILP